MKYLKDLNEDFKLFQLREEDEGYPSRVDDDASNIAMQELGISEKAFDAYDRMDAEIKKIKEARIQEYNAIVTNSKALKFRPHYCAEIVYHTLYKGRLEALSEREWINGGLKV